MNSYQRLMSTLAGQPVDRPPVFAVLGAYGAKVTGVDMRTLFSDAAAYVAGQQALQTEFGFDLVMSPFDFSAIAEAFGGVTAWSMDQAPNMRQPATRSTAEALARELPDPRNTGRLAVFLEATRRLAQLYKERVPIIGVLPGPAILPSLLTGIEQWMETVLFDRDAARKLLQHCSHFFVGWASALLEAGADCLVITEGMASAEIAPSSLFCELFLPHLQATFSRIDGPKVISSTGGRINHTINLLPSLSGLAGVIIGSKDDLTEARLRLGPDLTLIGNLDNLTLPAASPARVHEMCLDCLRSAAPSGHYILANAGADIPLATPPENLRAMLSAATDYSAGLRCAQ